MPAIRLNYKRVPADEKKYGKGFSLNSLSSKEFRSFNHGVLGLGDVSAQGQYVQSLAVFLDLQGFTDFCNQVDSHLVIPEFMRRYLEWLFGEVSDRFKEGEEDDTVRIWGSLPFFAKFLGDGVFFLWDTEYSGGSSGICNIVAKLYELTREYNAEFVPSIQKHVSKPPTILRCGISRGQIISIGQGKDYVGSCINVASRLQKLSQLTFAVSRRGFDLSQNPTHFITKLLTLKKAQIRGIGEDELIWVLSSEFDSLPEGEKTLFEEP